MTRQPRLRDDEGTILLLVLGFTAVLMLMVAVVVNVSAVILAKRGLASTADGAAVSAAPARTRTRSPTRRARPCSAGWSACRPRCCGR